MNSEEGGMLFLSICSGCEGYSMGTWGTGNFDNDYSRDFLAFLVERWEQLIEKILAGEVPEELAAHDYEPGLDACEECVMPMVEVMILVAERLDPDYLPASETVERWRSQYLSLFDRDCHQWDASPRFDAERRAIIDTTFGRLLNIVRSRQDGAGGADPGVGDHDDRN
jgi:hypothetical protein